MDTTQKSAVEIFGAQFNALEMLFGIELSGATPGARLESLGAVYRNLNSDVSERLRNFLDTPFNYANRFARSDSVFDAVTKALFSATARGAIHDYGRVGAPKKQHWMPLAYLSSFGKAVSTSKNSRSVSVPGISFSDGLTMNFETRDSTFIHEQTDGQGFYEDSAEYFFHLVESFYAQCRASRTRTIDHASVALFFFTQSIRNPRYGQRFLHSKLGSITDAILANIDAVGPGFKTRYIKTSKKMPFTPYVPAFVDRIEDARVYTLPIAPKMAFVMSTEELSEFSWAQTPQRYRHAVLRQAIRRGSYIFGVQKEEMTDMISRTKDYLRQSN